MDIQTAYQEAIKYAAVKHAQTGQTVSDSDVPYLAHVCNVAMEILVAAPNSAGFDTVFAVQAALLHDTLEDTAAKDYEIAEAFGVDILQAVQALTKDESLPKAEQMSDSLNRIKKLRKEVWAVKLADRITNLQPPPVSWTHEKRKTYLEESHQILDALKGGNAYLEDRLVHKIREYEQYFE